MHLDIWIATVEVVKVEKKVPRLFGRAAGCRDIASCCSLRLPPATAHPRTLTPPPPRPLPRAPPRPPPLLPSPSSSSPSPVGCSLFHRSLPPSTPPMKPVVSLSLGRKLPSAGSLLVGILVGLLVASVSRAMHMHPSH